MRNAPKPLLRAAALAGPSLSPLHNQGTSSHGLGGAHFPLLVLLCFSFKLCPILC